MVLMLNYRTMIAMCSTISTISLGLTAKSKVRYIVSLHNSGLNCVSLQFGSFVSIYTSVVWLSL
jgi:hypothetical protein